MLLRLHALRRTYVKSAAISRCCTFATNTRYDVLDDGDRIAHLSFRTPHKAGRPALHILGTSSLRSLTDDLHTLAKDDSLRALFMRDTIAGADLKYMRDIETPVEARDFIRLIDKLCTTIQDFPVPVVAVLSGHCLGAGMEVAAAADMRICCPDTVFGMPETKVGIPSVVQASLIPGLIGWGRARELLYFGDLITAKEAERIGFVNAVAAETDLDSLASKWSGRFGRVGHRAVRAQKQLMREWEEQGCGRPGVEAGVEAFGAAYNHDEPARMMKAFFDSKQSKKE